MATRSATRRTTKTTTSKTSKPKPEASAPAAKPKASASTPEVVSEMTAVVAGPDLKKPELLQLVAERAEMPKNKVKPIVEAMLAVMGEAIAQERGLNLQPMGKLKLMRSRDAGNAMVTVAKIRQSKPGEG